MNNKNNLLYQLYMLKFFGYNYIHKVNIISNKNVILPNNIDELNHRIINCNLCELSKNCSNKTINTNIENVNVVILVPELLSNAKYNIIKEILKIYLQIDIEDTVILNVIKCETGTIILNENIIDICKDYTIQEINIINPKIIFSFGNIYKYIINNVLDIGEFSIYNKRKLFYLNDLNDLLRNPSLILKNKSIFYKIKNEMEKP